MARPDPQRRPPNARALLDAARRELEPEEFDYDSDDELDEGELANGRAVASQTLAGFCGRGDSAAARALIEATPGIDLDARTSESDPPIVAAAAGGSLACVELLLSRGADPNAKNAAGARAVDFAGSSELSDEKGAALVAMLAGAGAELDAPGPYGLTPFLSACRHANLGAARELVRAGASADFQAGLRQAREQMGKVHERGALPWLPKIERLEATHAWLEATIEADEIGSALPRSRQPAGPRKPRSL